MTAQGTWPSPAQPGSTAPARAFGGALGVVPLWATAAVVGALSGEALAIRSDARSVALVALVAATVGVLALAAWARRQRCVVWSCAAGIAATSLVALVCAGGAAARVDAREHGLLPALARTGGEAEVEAVVAAEPRPIDRGWHVLIRVTAVDGRATRERAALVLPDDPPALGQRWRATVTAQPLPEGGYGRWLGRQHAVALLDVRSFEPSGRPGIAARVSEHVRERVRAAATHHLDDRVGGLLVGFVTGDTRLLPDEDRANMEATALTHLTAVSGSNVAIVIAGVVGAVTLLGAGARGRWAAVALAVPWFAYLTRFEPSVMRAGTMAALLLVADARGQARDARHALGVAVLVLLLVDPLLAGSLGLVLSATATAGVLVIAPVVRRRLPDRLPRPLATLVSITVGVQVAVVPVVLASFGELTLASIPANLVAVPAAMVAATLSFIGTVLALVHVELGAVAFALAAPGSWVTLTAADGLAGVGGVAELGRPATILALLGGCGWLLSRPRGRVARWWALATTVGLVAAMLPAVTATLPRNDFTVTAIDVGQSDAFLLESPSTRVLVDAGGDDSAARWLRTNGRRALDLVVVTHPHLDHVGGIAEVLETVEVGMVWAAPLATELPEAAEVHQVAAERGVPVRAPVAGEETVIGDLYVEVLHPPPGRPYRHEQSELNDSSYVLRFHHGEQRVLATGDVEAAAQRDLLDGDVEQLAAELMTVPHHGATTTEPAFITAVGAQIGLIGVGADNRHGHPHECILELLARDKVEVHRTDLDGTVTVPVPERRPRTPTSRSPAVAAGCTGAR